MALSHIIPEFIFSRMYDKKHRYLELADVDAGEIRLGQKGFREKLLCFSCEAHFNQLEKHVRRLFRGDLPQPESTKSRKVCITNVDPQILKLFLLSVLWRAGVSSLPIFKHVNLGSHEERLRKILLSGAVPPANTYPCVVIPLLYESEHFKGYIVEPVYGRTEGHKYYWFVFGGFVFKLFVSSHTLPAKFQRIMLPDTGPFFLYPTELAEFTFLVDVWNRAKESTRDAVTSFGAD